MWIATKIRDPRFYSSFVYAVKSTKVFCRPTCSSKKPSRDRVEFFQTAGLAEEAGYRACLRCKPLVRGVPPDVAMVQKICDYMEENFESKIDLVKLSGVAGLSQFHLHRNFKKITGVTPRQYLEAVRVRRAKLALKNGDSTRKSTYKTGHSSASWLYSGEKLGMPPSSYKSGGDGLYINYALADCSLGRVLVAATGKGVCFVGLGDNDEKLVAHLQNEYPNAIISAQGEGSEFNEWISEIVKYLAGRSRLEEAHLPVDVTATAFQMRVWKELQDIPYGKTLSYNEVAVKIGNPKAYRAVANACGSNRVPLIIPCHRVVRKNGDLGGYRWGVGRKQKLLDMESRNPPRTGNA